MNLKKEEWNVSYRNKDNFVFYPHEEIIRFSAKYIAKRVGLEHVDYIAQQNCKVLDLGCGIGRHIVFFEKLGINTYGVDLSQEAVTVAKQWLEKENIDSEERLFCGSAEKLPWRDNEFSFIVSHGVLDSMPFEIARNIMKECHRIINDDGLFYCDLIGDETKFGVDFEEEVVVESRHEKGTIQSYFTRNKIENLIENLFEIKEIKKIINQNVATDTYISRYHVVLKKKVGVNE